MRQVPVPEDPDGAMLTAGLILQVFPERLIPTLMLSQGDVYDAGHVILGLGKTDKSHQQV